MNYDTRTKDVDRTIIELALPDAASTADTIINQAVNHCAQKLRLEDHQKVLERLQQHEASACKHCCYSIAKQAGEAVGLLDQNVKAVYVLDYDATPDDVCFAPAAQINLLHLIVWAEPKTRALTALVEALDRALVTGLARILGRDQLEHLLDVQLVDDADVKTRIGYGARLSSLYQRPIMVWKR